MNIFEEKMRELGASPGRGEDEYVATEDDLLRLQAKLSAPLPDDYRSFVMRYGITKFSKSVWFPLPEGCPHGAEAHLEHLYGLDPLDDYLGVECNQWSDASWGPDKPKVPNNFLCIAGARMDDGLKEAELWFEVRLLLDEATCGEVQVLAYTTTWQDADYFVKNYEDISYRVAGSFREFLQGLEGRERLPIVRKSPTEERWIIWRAVSDNDMAFLQRMVEAGGHLSWVDKDWGRTVLRLAASFGTIEAMGLLLDNGADIHGALSTAAHSGNLKHMKFLIERGADVNERTQWCDNLYDYTPLMQARRGSGTRRFKKRATQLLLQHGADPKAKSRIGWDAFQCTWGIDEHSPDYPWRCE